jgi:diadenosine tetraphosphate (Ap4A) HIT family hydrolase
MNSTITELRDSGCTLCNAVFGVGSDERWNQIIFESPNFAVIPSLGSLVEGWLLIVPKKHFISAAVLPEPLLGEMMQLKQDVSEALALDYGQVCIFEHGPVSAGRSTGCGVDHAHVHVVPVAADLITASQPYLPGGVNFNRGTLRDCRIEAEKGFDYLYVEQPVGVGFVAFSKKFESQTFRRGVASIYGCSSEYNWRNYPKLETVQRTIDRLAAKTALDLALAL